ncbi:hypothetical protein GCM10027188_24940 [Lysobacter humi (ex Lee et al. 2017)]
MDAQLQAVRLPRRRRVKHKGRSEGRFIRLYAELLDSDEFGSLSAAAVKLFMELARQYRGKNNGDLQAAWKLMRTRGWRSPGTLDRAKKELVESGFAIVTRQGGKNRCSLYALTFWPVDACNGKHAEPPGVVPLHLWKRQARTP